jgi:hypothetical protein
VQQILPSPCQPGGGGDAAPADSGADASVRLAGRTARTQLIGNRIQIFSLRLCQWVYDVKKRQLELCAPLTIAFQIANCAVNLKGSQKMGGGEIP